LTGGGVYYGLSSEISFGETKLLQKVLF